MCVLNLCKCSASYLGMVILWNMSTLWPFLGRFFWVHFCQEQQWMTYYWNWASPRNLPRMKLLHLGYEWWASCFMGNTNSFRTKKCMHLNLCKFSASYLGMGHFVKYVKVIAFPRSPSWGSFLPRAVVDNDHIIELELPREIFSFCRFENICPIPTTYWLNKVFSHLLA